MLLPMLVKALMSGCMNGEFTYVVRGAEISCSEGSDPGVLNLPLSHGIYIKEQPVMNVADVIPLDNVGRCGFCKKDGSVCEPDTFFNKWSQGKEDVLVEGEAALLSRSELICRKGGIIKIEMDGQM